MDKTAELPAPPKRRLQLSNVAALNVAVPGLGMFSLQGVGSTARSHGFDGRFQAEGADEPARGSVRLTCRIGENLRIGWHADHASYGDPLGLEVVEKMLDLLGELPERYPAGLVGNVEDELRHEIREYDRDVELRRGRLEYLVKVEKELGVPADKLEALRSDRAQASARLDELESGRGIRVEKLRLMADTLKTWSHETPREGRRPFMEVWAEAAGHDVPAVMTP